ncbi:FAD-dependent monooxygenase [Streptomyces sp. NPDC001678]|uniref:FAD-dependent monooxygenase n=1 Tax=Streptomyces sp. NPDC001678 TaxID=3364599 RepID=UPI0036C43A98
MCRARTGRPAVAGGPRTRPALPDPGIPRHARNRRTLSRPRAPIPALPPGFRRVRRAFRRPGQPFPYALALPQHRTTALLEEYALKNGALIARGAEVTGIGQDEDGAELTVRRADGVRRIRADYIAGCDGARSAVRRLSGIAASHTVHPYDVISVDARLDLEPQQPWSRWGPDGMVLLLPFGDGRWRVILYPYRRPEAGDAGTDAPDAARVQALLYRIAGRELALHEVEWLSRYRCEHRHAVRYRRHRVVLVGDAASMPTPRNGVAPPPTSCGSPPPCSTSTRCPRPGGTQSAPSSSPPFARPSRDDASPLAWPACRGAPHGAAHAPAAARGPPMCRCRPRRPPPPAGCSRPSEQAVMCT